MFTPISPMFSTEPLRLTYAARKFSSTMASSRKDVERMIQLTRLNNKQLMVNSDLIKFVEQSPDTLVTLITGEKIVVLEPAETVVARIVEFRRTVLRGLPFVWDASSSHSSLSQTTEHSDPEPER